MPGAKLLVDVVVVLSTLAGFVNYVLPGKVVAQPA